MFRVQNQPPEVFYKKSVLKNVAKFTIKQIIEKEVGIGVFLSTFLRTTSLQNTSGQLFLKFGHKDNRGLLLDVT